MNRLLLKRRLFFMWVLTFSFLFAEGIYDRQKQIIENRTVNLKEKVIGVTTNQISKPRQYGGRYDEYTGYTQQIGESFSDPQNNSSSFIPVRSTHEDEEIKKRDSSERAKKALEEDKKKVEKKVEKIKKKVDVKAKNKEKKSHTLKSGTIISPF